MADPIIQSNGRIGVLQDFMFQNEALLDKIPGVEIERTKIGNSAGEVDDILGKGTATAIESILIAAGIPEGAKFDEAAQAKLSEFLVKSGIDTEQVSTFVKDVGVVLNDKDLGPIYQRNAQADTKEILAAKTEAPDPESTKAFAGRTGMDARPDADAGDEKYVMDLGRDKIEQSPLPQPAEKVQEYAGRTGMDVKRETGTAPVNVHQMIADAAAKQTGTDKAEKPVNVHDMIAQSAQKTIEEGKYKSFADEQGKELVASTQKKVDDPDKGPDPSKNQDKDIVASKALPSFKGVGVPFLEATQHKGPAPLDVTKPGDISVTMADIENIKAKGDEMTPDEAKLVAFVEHQHKARLAGNPDYQKLMAQIETYEKGREGVIEDKEACQDRSRANSMALDTRMSIFEHDHGDMKMTFKAEVDGEMRTFNLSLNDIKNGNVFYKDEDGDIEKVRALEVVDRQAVKEAAYAMFDKSLIYVEPEAYADFKKDADQYNKDVKDLVSDKHTHGIASRNFGRHFRHLNHEQYMRDGKHYDQLREIGKMPIARIRDQAEQMRENMDEGLHIVKRTELDAFDPSNPDKQMVAQNNTTLEGALDGSTI